MTSTPQSTADPALKRTLSLPMTTFFGLGNILGAGIYVLVGKVVLHAGVFAPLAFAVAALLAALTAFSYAELAARFPVSAGAAAYVARGTGSAALAALVGGTVILVAVVASATVLRGFCGYLRVLVAVPELPTLLVSVLLLGGLAAWGISQSVTVAAAITLVETGGLLLIVGVGAPAVLARDPSWDALTPLLGLDAWYGVFAGAFLAFFAATGFEDMVNVAEEVREPERNLPRAIIAALAFSTLLYCAVAVVAVASLPAARLGASEAPLALLYAQATGREPVAITLIGMVAVINGALIQIVMAARVAHGMARRGWLPGVFGRVHPRTRTPVVATCTVAVLILALATAAATEALARATSVALLCVFCLVNFSLWRLKRGGAPAPAGIAVPRWVPALGGISALAFLAIEAVLGLSGARL